MLCNLRPNGNVGEEKNVKKKTWMNSVLVTKSIPARSFASSWNRLCYQQGIHITSATEEKNVKEKTRMDRFRGDRGTGDLIVGEDLIESFHIRSEGEAWR